MADTEDDQAWRYIAAYFASNPNLLVQHQLDSYNAFFDGGLQQLFREKNPITIVKEQDASTGDYGLRCELFFGGDDGARLYYGKPTSVVNNDQRPMYPNDARLMNYTYAFTVHYDVLVKFTIAGEESTMMLERMYLGRFPAMLQSSRCLLQGLDPEVRFAMGECRNDPGGYFVVVGKEKVIISQEKFADNALYVRKRDGAPYKASADIRSVSEDASKPTRSLSVAIVGPTPTTTNGQIVVIVPNVRKPVPLFILMRALGVISDKAVMEHCLLDLERYGALLSHLRPSVHDAGELFTQEACLRYIGTLTKGKTLAHSHDILTNYLLPHIGDTNYRDKALYIGYMVMRLLGYISGADAPTDRDSFTYKRVELAGGLLRDLFKEYLTLQQRDLFVKIDKEYYYHESSYKDNFTALIANNAQELFKERLVEEGVRKAFKGAWGAQERTRRPGLVQDLSRLSFNSFLSQLRKVNLPLDASAKVLGPRYLHATQWGIIDPLDTPDGGNIGLHKHLAIGAYITSGCPRDPMVRLLFSLGVTPLVEQDTENLAVLTKVFVNGAWLGATDRPKEISERLVLLRRNAAIPLYTSVRWSVLTNELSIATDAGRLCRPAIYVGPDGVPADETEATRARIAKGNYSWKQLVAGFGAQVAAVDDPCATADADDTTLDQTAAPVGYIDTAETEGLYIAMARKDIKPGRTLMVEIHPSLILGVMGNQIVFPENNQLPRDLFSCGQSKQAASLYSTNYRNRIDKSAIVLENGQVPLVKSRYLQFINREQNPYGENAIVAIMCYGGYNVEDAVLINEGAVKRGFFGTTYYTMYEAREESSTVAGSTVDTRFVNVEEAKVVGQKPGYDYSQLDEYGVVREGAVIDDKTVVIGMGTTDVDDPTILVDASVATKKGASGVVDRTFMTSGDEGFRLAKVRVRERRPPAIGDKVCSRCGQKGTVGLIVPEADMPFTAGGLRPDIIINPHALPSRMTIGQLVESVLGKVGAIYGASGDCTAFVNKGPKDDLYGKLLTAAGYSASGNQPLYNGMTGEPLEAQIFIGPTYYMRLKHMVKDKINYRARGPRTVLTRQTVQGRSNDGGLRVGEMERDCISSHGMAGFLTTESMMVRGDEFFAAVCNQTGSIAIYNESRNVFLSPMADGPIKFGTGPAGDLRLETVSRYGRNFSIIRVPYAFKLLWQELATMNIRMSLITADNIDQTTSLAFTDPMGDPKAAGDALIDQLKGQRQKGQPARAYGAVPPPLTLYEPRTPPVPASATYMPESPTYQPYALDSPEYMPESPTYQPYALDSPEYRPQFSPHTPPLPGDDSPAHRPQFFPHTPTPPPGDDTPGRDKWGYPAPGDYVPPGYGEAITTADPAIYGQPPSPVDYSPLHSPSPNYAPPESPEEEAVLPPPPLGAPDIELRGPN
jgi:DNA-directed RNA polymerase II subunit RPB2